MIIGYSLVSWKEIYKTVSKANETTWTEVVDGAHYVHVIGDDTVRLLVTWDGGIWFHVHIVYTDSHQALHVDSFERPNIDCPYVEWAKRKIAIWEEDNIDGDNWKEIYSDA